MGAPSLSTSWPSAAAAPRTIGPKSLSTASSAARVWTNVGERKRSSDGTGGDGAVVVPVPSDSSEPASAMNILVHGGVSAPHPAGRVEGIASPSWVLANVAAAAHRVAAHVARTAASIDGTGTAPFRPERSAVSTSSSQRALAGGAAAGVVLGPRTRRPARTASSAAWADASRPSREKSSCWLSAAGSPVTAAGPSPSVKPRRDSGSDGLRAPGRCVTSKRKSSISSSQRTYILFRCRFVFSHVIAWLSVRRSKSVQQPPGRGAPPPSR